MAINQYVKLTVMALLLWPGAASSALAQTPKEQLQATMESVMEIARTFRSAEDFADNKARLKQIILPRFDFTEMARRSLGSPWNELDDREKNDFVAAFLQFAEGSYMNAIGSYRGGKMTYGREQIDKNFAEVDTELFGRGEPAPIGYKLHLVGKEWKVYDVVIENVSLVSNYRSQFSRILKTEPIEELMRRLRGKAA